MNRKMVFKTVGLMLMAEAALLLLPTIVALIYRESSALWLSISAAVALVLGWGLNRFIRPESDVIYAREGFITVAMTWLRLSAVGALPFFLSREIPS